MSLIKIKNGSFKYEDSNRFVFTDTSFEINKQQIVKVAGRNGTGKSTLLKILSGLLQLTQGKFIKNSDTHIIYMDQHAGEMLAHDLTITEQLDCFNYANKIDVKNTLLQFGLNLEHRLNDFIGHLSGGQRQIVALLTVINSGAEIICLDEFSSALDAQATEIACKIIEYLKNELDLTIIIVSHDELPINIDAVINLKI